MVRSISSRRCLEWAEVLWVLARAQIDWASMRRILLVLHIPEGVVSTLDRSDERSTQREWGRGATRRGPDWSQSYPFGLGPTARWGALAGFQRLESMEEAALIR